MTAVIPVKTFSDDHFLVMCTKGLIKKTALSEYKTDRKIGIQGSALLQMMN